jgi:hypothetical protein
LHHKIEKHHAGLRPLFLKSELKDQIVMQDLTALPVLILIVVTIAIEALRQKHVRVAPS